MTENRHQLVKRFVAPTMTRALELVQREMGPEAVILSSQKVDKGVEIVTSLEPDLPTRGIDVRRQFGQNFDADLDRALPSDTAWRSQAGVEKAAAHYGGETELNAESFTGQKPPSELAKEIEAAREKMFAAKKQAQMDHSGVEAPRRANTREALEEALRRREEINREQINRQQSEEAQAAIGGAEKISELDTLYEQLNKSNSPKQNTPEDKEQMERLQSEIADVRMLLEQQLWRMSERSVGAGQVQMPQQVDMPNHSSALMDHLSRLGLTESMAQELLAHISPQTRVSVAWRECMGILAKRIPVCEEGILDKSGVYAFLGQTGVGKTTTIAKLAAQYVLKHGPGKVALVTTDTYRVGAFDQLRTMGRILNVPVRVVDGENSLLTVLASLRQFSMILIDTAGFRLGDPLLKAQLEQLESCSIIKRILVMSCNSQMATMKAAVHAHRGSLGLHACVLTKLDESATIGEAMSLVVKEKLSVAYTTDGQNIPKDISPASGHKMVVKAVKLAKEQAGLGEQNQAL